MQSTEPRGWSLRTRLVLALARVEGRAGLLLRRASAGELLEGLWGLPGVSVPDGKDPAGVLGARAPDALGLRLEVGREIATVTRLLTHRRLEMRIHHARLRGGIPTGSVGLRFTTAGEASSLPTSTAMLRAIEASGGWSNAVPRAGTGRKRAGEQRKALTSRGPTV